MKKLSTRTMDRGVIRRAGDTRPRSAGSAADRLRGRNHPARWNAAGVLLLAALSLASPASARTRALHVQGNLIKDSAGHTIRLRGVNIPSLEWSALGEHVRESLGVAVHDWHANIIRLPLSQDRWFGMGDYQSDGGAAYRALVDAFVEDASRLNVYVILDLHHSDAGAWRKSPGQHKMPDSSSEVFWIDAATRYANRPEVLFGLYNEPHDVSWEIWKNGGDVEEKDDKAGATITYRSPGLQKLLDDIRAAGARNPVIAGGLDWGYDLSEILRGKALQDKTGLGVIYDTHVYPWKGSGPANWDPHFGDASRTVPVIAGELGCEPDAKQTSPYTWAPAILGYLDRLQIHWTAWCFHPGASPRLLKDWKYTPTPYWGAFVKASLTGQPLPTAPAGGPAPL